MGQHSGSNFGLCVWVTCLSLISEKIITIVVYIDQS